jgi:hypothetical protein
VLAERDQRGADPLAVDLERRLAPRRDGGEGDRRLAPLVEREPARVDALLAQPVEQPLTPRVLPRPAPERRAAAGARR